MPKRNFYDPYAELLNKFNLKGVKYIVIGASGINYYAQDATSVFVTADFDVFIKPTIDNVEKAISIFKELGYDLSSGGKIVTKTSTKDIVRNKKTVLVTNPYGITFELILSVSGYTFNQMEMDARVFDAGKVPIKVGKLSKLLMSKKVAGREKDKLFLKRYEILLKERKK